MKLSHDGFSLNETNEYVIFINKNTSENRRRFTIAHELGHIILNHHNIYNLNILGNDHVEDSIESEANMFARLLLCPAHLMSKFGKEGYKMLKVSKQMYEVSLKYIQYDLYNMKKGGTVTNEIAYTLSDLKTPVTLKAHKGPLGKDLGSATFEIK